MVPLIRRFLSDGESNLTFNCLNVHILLVTEEAFDSHKLSFRGHLFPPPDRDHSSLPTDYGKWLGALEDCRDFRHPKDIVGRRPTFKSGSFDALRVHVLFRYL